MSEAQERVLASEPDWQAIRKDFEVTERVAYLNSAASGPVPRPVRDAAVRFYDEILESGDHLWEHWLARRERARESVARLINAEPDEIAFTTNTSQGMNLIVDALEGTGEVISCRLEFPVSTIPWIHRGIGVRMIEPVDGELRTEDVLAAMDEKTSVICLSHVQYSNGFRSDLEEFGRNKGRHTFVINASQSAGVFPIDVKRMRIDAICSTGHKWMLAGYGSGFIYMSRELLERTRARAISWMSVEDPFGMRNDAYTLRTDAAPRAETGCPHFAGIFAIGRAAEYSLETGPERIAERALSLNRLLTERLTAAGWRVLSPLREEKIRSAETLVAAEDPRAIVRHLARHNVAVTIKPEGFRAATHFFNDESDVDRLVFALEEFQAV